jgi:hypothetical protein
MVLVRSDVTGSGRRRFEFATSPATSSRIG